MGRAFDLEIASLRRSVELAGKGALNSRVVLCPSISSNSSSHDPHGVRQPRGRRGCSRAPAACSDETATRSLISAPDCRADTAHGCIRVGPRGWRTPCGS